MRVSFRTFILLLFSVFAAQESLAQKRSTGLSEHQRMEFDRHFFAAVKEKMIRNYKDAEIEFRQALAIDPDNANAHFQLSSVLMFSKKPDEAMLEAEKAFKLEPGNEWYGKFLVEQYKSARRYKDAVSVCEKAFKVTSKDEFLTYQADLESQAGNYKGAIKTLDKIESRKGVSEEISRRKEELYLKLNKPSKAIAELEKLSSVYPDVDAYKGMLADLYMADGREKEALDIYRKIQERDPLNGFAAFSLADYYYDKHDTAGYFKQLQIGIRSSVEPRTKLQVLAKLIPSGDLGPQHFIRCEQLVDDFIQANPASSEPYLFKADLQIKKRNLAEARSYYLKATELNSNELVAWDQIVFCDQQLQRFDWMKEDCAEMIRLFPEYPSPYLYHSIACRYLKEYLLAVSSARLGIQRADEENVLIQMLNNLGDVAHYAGMFELSDSAFEATLALQPSNSMALNNYAYFLSLRNTDLDKAESMSKRSIQLDPDNPSNLDTYGWILFVKKKYPEAKIQIEKALDLMPNNAEILEHYGDILFMLNEKDLALEKWKKALDLGADSDALKRKVQTGTLPLP